MLCKYAMAASAASRASSRSFWRLCAAISCFSTKLLPLFRRDRDTDRRGIVCTGSIDSRDCLVDSETSSILYTPRSGTSPDPRNATGIVPRLEPPLPGRVAVSSFGAIQYVVQTHLTGVLRVNVDLEQGLRHFSGSGETRLRRVV